MKQKKLNCIRGKLRRRPSRLGGLLALTLAALLLASPALAAGDNAIVPRVSLDNKPEVTIQGNVVVDDKGVPTGFYELALCVRSPKRIVDVNGVTDDPAAPGTPVAAGTEISESAYNAYVAANPGTEGDFTVTYYPFAAASAVVEINADALTPVNWDVESVTYGEWDATANAYQDATLDAAYPRGIDLTPTAGGNYDPDVWSDTDPAPFPDITAATLQGIHRLPVALDAEGDRSAFTAAAQVDDYSETTKAALVTLSAHAPDNKPVIYTTSTPVAVVRFAYDLARFPKNTVMVNAAAGDARNRLTGTTAAEGFWLGLDRGNNTTVNNGKTPLTWLADTAQGTGGNSYDYSDSRVAASEAGQAVWTKLSSKDSNGTPMAEWVDTEYYYYLGGENPGGTGAEGSVAVATATGVQNVEHVWTPNTASRIKILAEGTDENPMPGAGDAWTQAGYSYYSNLISLNGGLRLELVNAPTFRAPRGKGIGGNQILFYDWDDTLIGALIVDDGDVRGEVNKYVEQNLVHPDLRSGDLLNNQLGGTVPDFTTPPAAGSDAETYQNLISSLDREYTYRGQYPTTPSPEGTTTGAYPEDPTDPAYDPDLVGSAFPLTNKLDYVFYKHLNTVTTVETENANGKRWTENYFTLNPLTDDAEAAKYPWAYGWAVVEDAANQTVPNKANWPVMVDSVKLADTWTTFGVGELEGMDPAAGNANTAFATPAAGTTQTSVYPGGLSADWSADATKDPTAVGYTYQTSSADANGYLRFADFSDMSKLLKKGQNVIVVKAVYEPGTVLDLKGYYSIVPGSLGISRLGTASSSENSIYAFDYQYQRANASTGNLIGVGRTREPAVRTGFVFDAKAVDTKEDLAAQKTFFLKNIGENTDIMDIQLTTGGALWKLEYTLLDIYNLNISNGTTRSLGGEWNLKTGFVYETPADPGVEWTYDERQGTDGFVVEATLNTLLAEATKEAREAGSGSLADHASLRTIQDLNFKRNINKDGFTGITAPRFVNYLQDLVSRLYADGKAIDPKTGNVVLGWHQIQQHIILCEAAGGVAVPGIYSGGVLKSEGDCIAIGYEWCRMDTCGGNSTMPINSYHDVLKALSIINKGSSDPGYNAAYKAIYGEAGTANTGVAATDLFSYGFRQHADGVPYDPADPNLKDAILDDLKDAVKVLAPTLGTDPDWSTVTWVQVQEAVIQGNMGAATPPALDLWWQATPTAPNGTPPTIDSWEKLWKYSIHDTLGVDMDGDGTPDAVVSDAFDGFDQTALDALVSEKPGTSTATNVGWFRTGKVTTVGGEETAEKFTAEGFTTAWAKALQALTSAPAPYTAATVNNATWEEIQFALIHGTYKSHADIMNDTSIDYWWKNGGSPKLTFAKLLDAVNDYYFLGDATKLDAILKNGPKPINNEIYLRKDSDGTEFETADEFKTIVQDAIDKFVLFATNPSDFLDSNGKLDATKVDEYVLQYILIHYNDFMNGTITTVPDKDAIRADSVNNDYWWFAGGKPTKPMPLKSVKDLFKAYLWYKGDTATGVGGQNAQALGDLDAATLTALGLRKDGWGVTYAATATNAELIATVDSALAKLPYNMKALNSVDEADLALEIQYLLAEPTATYQSAGVLRGSGTSYWWQEGDKSYPVPTSQKEVLEAVWKAHIGNAGGETVPEAETALKALSMDFITNRKDGMAMRKDLEGKAFASADAFYTALCQAADAMAAGGQGYGDLDNITQRQLQWMLLGNAYDTDTNVQNATIDLTDPAKPVDAYWWFTSDSRPSEEPTRKEKPIDPAKWSAFIQGLNDYAMLGNDAAFNDGTITLDMVNDELYLRKADGSKFASWSEVYDGSTCEIICNALFALMADPDKYMEFWDQNDGCTLIKEPTWYEFQYAIIHTDEINTNCVVPSLSDIKAEAEDEENGYTWRYETTEPTPPEPTRTEKPIDPAKWSAFIQGLNDYAMMGSDAAFNDGTITLDIVNDELLLRKADGSKFANWSEVYDGSTCETICNALFALMADPDKYMEFWDQNDGCTLIKEPTWYEFQYAIIHMDEINTNCVMPGMEDIQAECEEKWEWKYETSGGADPEPTVTEIEIDPAKWSTFIQSLNDYAMIGSPEAFTDGSITLSLINDELLLRKADGTPFANWGEVYDGSTCETICNALFALMADPDKYAEFWDSEGDGVTLIKEPTWYELQYAIIHMDEINTNCVMPSVEEIKVECKEKWAWKYTSGSSRAVVMDSELFTNSADADCRIAMANDAKATSINDKYTSSNDKDRITPISGTDSIRFLFQTQYAWNFRAA